MDWKNYQGKQASWRLARLEMDEREGSARALVSGTRVAARPAMRGVECMSLVWERLSLSSGTFRSRKEYESFGIGLESL